MMMIKAGAPVDEMLDKLAAAARAGRHRHRRRQLLVQGHAGAREAAAPSADLHFVGSGVSGGEEGARYGPSLMPGGTREAWEAIRADLRSDRREERLRAVRHPLSAPTAPATS